MIPFFLLFGVLCGVLAGDLADLVGVFDWSFHEVNLTQRNVNDVGGATYPEARFVFVWERIPGSATFLLTGGADAGDMAVGTTWIYDTEQPDVSAWTQVADGLAYRGMASMPSKTDGYVTTFTGMDDPTSTIQDGVNVYDALGDTWYSDISVTGSRVGRLYGTVWPTKTGDGFYLGGGVSDMDPAPVTETFEFIFPFAFDDVTADPPTGVWQTPITTTNPGTFLVLGVTWVDFSGSMERLYFYGGTDLADMYGDIRYVDIAGSAVWTELYSVAANTAPDYVSYLPGCRTSFGTKAAQNGQYVYFFGGADAGFSSFYGDLWELDLSTLDGTLSNGVTWVKIENSDSALNAPPDYTTVGQFTPGGRTTYIGLFEDTIYIFGGMVEPGQRNDVWAFSLCETDCTAANNRACVKAGQCECALGWTGYPACTSCAANFAPPTCAACIGNFELPACDVCGGNWEGDDCDECGGNWEGDDCDECDVAVFDNSAGLCATVSGVGSLAQIIGGVVGGIAGVVILIVVVLVLVLVIALFNRKKGVSVPAAVAVVETTLEDKHHSSSSSSSSSSG